MADRLVEILSMTGVWVGGLAVAAFLVLSWALRGAPIGQAAGGRDEDDGAPGAGYRDRVVASAVFGLVLIGVGAYVAGAVSIPWSLPLFALGFGILIALVSVNRRHRHASPTLRRVVSFADSALTASLLAGVLLVGNVLAFRYGGRAIDFTRDRAFSLSSQTVNQLKALEKPATFTAFLAAREPALRVRQLLELYKAENPGKIKVVEMNPFRDLDRFDELRKRASDVAVAAEQGGGVVVEYGEEQGADRLVVRADELFEIPRPDRPTAEPGRFESTFIGEDALTSALIRLREGKKSTVAFTTGHGELPGDSSDASRPGLGLFRARLAAIGSEVVDVNLVGQDVPPEASLLVIGGPQRPFQPEEVARLKAYMAGGGHVLAMLNGEQPTGLEDWLKGYKVGLGTARIVEPRQSLRGRPELLAVLLGGLRHPIVDPLARQFVIMPNASPLTVLAESAGGQAPGPASASVATTAIARTTRESWAETEPGGPTPERDAEKEAAGPFAVGLAVAELAQGEPGRPREIPRLVVFGSREPAEDTLVARNPTNLDLVMNAVHWLRGRPEVIGIAPKTHVALTFTADPRMRARLILVPTLMAVLVIVGLGVTTYLARRA